MKFTPQTEEDLKRATLLAPGTYDFEVTSAEEALSKKAKERGETESDMIALKLRIFSDNGERTVRDWLMPSMGFKLKHFADTTGLTGAYDAGTLCAEDCKGRSGRVILVIKDSEQYGPQNNVKDYEKAKAGAEPAMVKAPEPSKRIPTAGAAAVDEIPFARFTSADAWG
jgi:hypothetical protein